MASDQQCSVATAEAEYEAGVAELMEKIGSACDGKSNGMVSLALINCLSHAALGGDRDLRKLILETIPEFVAEVEAMDGAMH